MISLIFFSPSKCVTHVMDDIAHNLTVGVKSHTNTQTPSLNNTSSHQRPVSRKKPSCQHPVSLTPSLTNSLSH
jgi:hypothetical protein